MSSSTETTEPVGSGDGSETRGSLRSRVDLAVFLPAAAITLIFVIWGLTASESLTAVTGVILDFLVGDIGWVYVLAMCGVLGVCAFLVFSRYGRIRLGKDEDRPEFRTSSWISMMFAAGMGIALLFYGVAEPLSHFAAPPPGLAEPKTEDAARVAMEYTFLHWGITGWAVYAVAGLALAYFGYRHGGRNLMSTACRPVLGDRVDGPLGSRR